MGIYISTAFGFLGGLVFNYIVSLAFVLKSAKEQKKGRDIFFIIGVVLTGKFVVKSYYWVTVTWVKNVAIQ